MLNITKTYQKYTQINTVLKKFGKNLDAREKWYEKAEIHELDDEKSLSPPDFGST
jgi:hypothetical protein